MTKYKQKPSIPQLTLADAPQNHIYTTSDKEIDVISENGELWVSQKGMGELFGVSQPTISYHIKSVIKDDNLSDSIYRKIRYIAGNGKTYEVNMYNMRVVIPVGFRVNSSEATAFRAWASAILEQHLVMQNVVNNPSNESKALLKMQKEINIYEKADMGNIPQIIHLKSEVEIKRSLKALNDLLSEIIDSPEYARIHDTKHLSLFGATSKQIKAMLETKDIHKSLPTLQLDILDFTHRQIMQVLRMQGNIDNARALQTVVMVVKPLGVYLRGLCDELGIDHITGKPLLESGNQ